MLKLNLSNPQAGTQKCIEFDDISKKRVFYEKTMGQQVSLDSIGPEFKGYTFKITGGNDNDGFPMKQGVKVNGRVRLLLIKGHSCYRPKRSGQRKRKSVRGCIVGEDIRVLALKLIKKGQAQIQGLTDTHKAKRLGPKRASKIRRLYGFKKDQPKELIKKNVIKRTFKTAQGKDRVKAPKIQRLITDARIRRKAILKKLKAQRGKESQKAAQDYRKTVQEYRKSMRQVDIDKDHKNKQKQKEAPKKEGQTATKATQKKVQNKQKKETKEVKETKQKKQPKDKKK